MDIRERTFQTLAGALIAAITFFACESSEDEKQENTPETIDSGSGNEGVADSGGFVNIETESGAGLDAQVECGHGQVPCGSRCASLANDIEHCGSCDRACGPGHVCSNGACALTCEPQLKNCNGTCVNPQIDPFNCGACSNACPQGEVCVLGSCETICPSYLENCDGICVDIATDSANCGACGKSCGAGETCTKDGCTSLCKGPTTEICDYCDNDCDGDVDEGFVDEQGKYTTDTACGNCANDCSVLITSNSMWHCNSEATPRCVMSCNTGWLDLNQSAVDGCEFHLDTQAIYVSNSDPSALDDVSCGLGPTGTGSGYHPCQTISYGIGRAQSASRPRVNVAAGDYIESVTVVAGISLYGGYNANTWERNPGSYKTGIYGDTLSGHRKTVVAQRIQGTPTAVDGFLVFGETASGLGQSSYAFYIAGCDSSLAISNNVIIAGNGGPGSPGTTAINANAGTNGSDGANAYEPSGHYNCYDGCLGKGAESLGGNGGALICDGVDVSGGRGAAAVCPDFDTGQDACTTSPSSPYTQSVGSGSSAPSGGSGGLSGCHSYIDYAYTGSCSCILNNEAGCSQGINGANGSNGPNGNNSEAGLGCTLTEGSVVNAEWVGGAGTAGVAGNPGFGGGGGGSGGGVETVYNASCSAFGWTDIGGSGGGGGSGGCGGRGGDMGLAGGGSFALFVIFSSAPGSVPQIHDNSIRRGAGGAGGSGGNGSGGGSGGKGGAGGLEGKTTATFCAGPGGRGGDGGYGGIGGGGGGGCGGASYGIFCSGYGAFDLIAWKNGNVFLSGGEGGPGGSGGTSPGGSSGTAGQIGGSAATNF